MSQQSYSLAELASSSGLSLPIEVWENILAYQDYILQENEKLNLTAITDSRQFTQKHIVDSLAVAKFWGNNRPHTLIDVGTGAGFPGFILGLAYPAIEVTLVESIEKKAKVLSQAQVLFGCTNITVINNRSEFLVSEPAYYQQFDVSIARAVAPLDKLLPLLEPFIRQDGTIVAMKGQKAQEELETAKSVLSSLSLECTDTYKYTLPEEQAPRTMLVFRRHI
jgi:16S rRNA (guanine527-N7)-methyltransferase